MGSIPCSSCKRVREVTMPHLQPEFRSSAITSGMPSYIGISSSRSYASASQRAMIGSTRSAGMLNFANARLPGIPKEKISCS